MKTRNTKVLAVLCLLTLASCGGSKGDSKAPAQNPPQEQVDSRITQGTYKTILRAYNFNLSGFIPNGVTDITVTGDNVVIKSWLDDSRDVTHMQNIHVGTVCPGPEHDTNNDGYVDINETIAISGNILVPLDSDLSVQTTGTSVFPRGNFSYFQKASLADMMYDLQSEDLDKSDSIVKLSPNKGLNLDGKVIIVMGADTRNLPASIATINGQTKELSVPIACGVIQRREPIASN